jgi:glucose-1-phosphate thymidylyltransferase
MLAGIRDFIVITTPEEQQVFKTLLWDVEDRMGIRVEFAVQDQPRGIADAFNVVDASYDGDLRRINHNEFDRFVLILGDNIFYGAGMSELLSEIVESDAPTIIAAKVKDPERFGVVTLDTDGYVVDLEEKPLAPKSDLAITGIYFFNKSVFHRASRLKPSMRRELEITDLVKTYWNDNSLKCIRLPRGAIWFDTGTADSLLEAANMIAGIQKHQGFMVGNPHEIAYNKGWINKIALSQTAFLCEKSAYGQYLLELLS